MTTNLHSQSQCPKTVLSYFQPLFTSGEGWVTHGPTCPSCHHVILLRTMNGEGMEFQESTIWFLFEPRSLGPACPMWGPRTDTGHSLPAVFWAADSGLGLVSWRSAAAPHPLWTEREAQGAGEGLCLRGWSGEGMPHGGGKAAWAELGPEPEAF